MQFAPDQVGGCQDICGCMQAPHTDACGRLPVRRDHRDVHPREVLADPLQQIIRTWAVELYWINLYGHEGSEPIGDGEPSIHFIRPDTTRPG